MASKRGARFCGGRTVIWMFQNTGTRFIVGLRAGLSSAAVGVKTTRPPAARRASALAHLSVTSTSAGAAGSIVAGEDPQVQSFPTAPPPPPTPPSYPAP